MKALLSVAMLGIFSTQDSAPINRVEGRVVDTFHMTPVAGANVRIEGIPTLIVTDPTGSFTVSVASKDSVNVTARRIGYYPARGKALLNGDGLSDLEIGIDPVMVCLDYCPSEPVPTPGYVRVKRIPNTR